MPIQRRLLRAVLLALALAMLMKGQQVNASLASMQHRQRMHIQRDSIDIKDKIIELQCLARCETEVSTQTQHQRCLDHCIRELPRTPRRGSCPQLGRQTRLLSCLDNCQYDHDCAEVQKCCSSGCGPVCVEPLGVRNDTQLPPIPKISSLRPGSHKVELTIESSPLVYYFHVEVCSHIGRLFATRKLGLWQWQKVQKIYESQDGHRKWTKITFNLRPGRWYQVRVAAVNAFGYRGYSQPTSAFPSASNPKPPKAPNDSKIISKQYDGRYMNVKLVWCPSRSNLPVEKYKIMWSLYVKSQEGSLIREVAYVKDSHQFDIKNLLPNSSYYIQVQAICFSGSRRLKSDKKDLFFNTTLQSLEPYSQLECSTQSYKRLYHQHTTSERSSTPAIIFNEVTPVQSLSPLAISSPASYEVRFRLNRKFGMIVQIFGFQPHKEKVYELCPQETNCEQREFSAIRAKKDSLEFSKLKYNTTYVLKALRSSPNSILDDTRNAFTFTTPKCENFRKSFPKVQIKCND
ncbi:anosmin-1 isoform X2 [Drosophila willistoni]|nr:anosmin-1 isoform X2 [Drosophila willistoni]